MVEFRFGGKPPEFLSVTVKGRAYHQSHDYWDGNWLLVDVMIAAGKFSGSVPGLLRAEELARFRTELQAFTPLLKGVIYFTTNERWLDLRVEAGTSGYIRVSGTINDEFAKGNSLNFTIDAVQESMVTTLKQLEHVVERYPVVGRM